MQSLGENPSDHELNLMLNWINEESTAPVSGTAYLLTVARRLVMMGLAIFKIARKEEIKKEIKSEEEEDEPPTKRRRVEIPHPWHTPPGTPPWDT